MSIKRPRSFDEAKRRYLRARAFRDFSRARAYVHWMRKLRGIDPIRQRKGKAARKKGMDRQRATVDALRAIGLNAREMSEARRGNMGDIRIAVADELFIIQVRDQKSASVTKALLSADNAVMKANRGTPVAYVIRNSSESAWMWNADFQRIMYDQWAMGNADRFTMFDAREKTAIWREWRNAESYVLEHRGVPEVRPPAVQISIDGKIAIGTWWDTFVEAISHLTVPF